MSGKRAKPRGAAPSDPVGQEPAAESPGAQVGSSTATGLLDRAPTAAAVLPGQPRTGSRNAARQERRRRERRRRLTLAAAAALVLVSLVGWYVVGRGDSAPSTAASPSGRTQQTVLLEVGDRLASGVALLAVDPTTGQGAVVLIPPRLTVEAAGYGTMTVAEATALPAPDAAADAIADTLGITIDQSWQLTPQALAALVDAAGGVEVDVDVDVTASGESPGSQVILIPAGPQRLDGTSAAIYAAFLAEGEPEQSRLARLDVVLGAALRALPPDRAAVTLQLGSLGAGSAATAPEQLTAFLAALRAAEDATSVVHRTLPVTSIDSGASVPALALDADGASALVSDLLGGSIAEQRPGGGVRVLVQNGVGTPGLGATARDVLVAEGFTYVAGGNAASFGARESLVLIPDSTPQLRAEGAAVAAALGLPETAVRVTTQGQSVADLVVVLGKDYEPRG